MKRYVSMDRFQISDGKGMYVVAAPPACPVQDAGDVMMALTPEEAGLGPGELVEMDGQRVVVIQVGRGRAPGTMIVMTRTEPSGESQRN